MVLTFLFPAYYRPISVRAVCGVVYVSPPFCQFFLCCGGFIDRSGQRDHPLSSALMSLLNDIWSPSWYLRTVATGQYTLRFL